MAAAAQIDYSALADQARKTASAPLDYSALAAQARKTSSPDSATAPDDETQHGFWRSIWDTGIKPIYDAVADAHDRGDLGEHAATELIRGLADQAGKFAASGGDLKELPVIGPVSKKISAQIETKNYSGALGTLAGFAGSMAAPEAAGAAADALGSAKLKVLPALPNPNPAVADAVDFGLKRGIPVDAGTATGNFAVKGAQHLADRSIGGSMANAGAPQAAADALTKTGRDLAADVHPAPVTPEKAGAAVSGAVEASSDAAAARANAAYGTLRQIEAIPANTKTVQVGTKTTTSPITGPNGQPVVTTTPITKDIALPVDMRPVKQALAPIEAEISQRMTPAQRDVDPALNAIRNILNRDDYLPASVADKDLSYLKKIQRGPAADPVKRVAGQAIDALDQQVQDAVSRAGPSAVRALSEGRTATIDKYAARDVLDNLREEPVQAFTQALWKNDAGIDQLRAVQKYAPAEMPKLGRAFVDDLVNQATAEGDFSKQSGIWSKWQSLGPETKKIIFSDPATVKNLDNFFLLAKKMGENPNPSGTAHVLSLGSQGLALAMQPHIAIPIEISGAILSKMLHNPAAVRTLTEGMQIPVGSAAAPFVAGKVLAAANRLGLAEEPGNERAQPIAAPETPPPPNFQPVIATPGSPQTPQGAGDTQHIRKLVGDAANQ